MTEANRDRMRARLVALLYAREDMSHVMQTAGYLLGLGEHSGTPADHAEGLPIDVRRTLEAGVVVTYCRPFTNSAVGMLRPVAGLPGDLMGLHDRLMQQRNQMYAHTDPGEHRELFHIDDWVGGDRDVSLESWASLTRHVLGVLRRLAAAHYEAFEAEAREVGDLLGTLAE